MAPIEYRTKVLADGHVSLPEGLRLLTGDEVRIIIVPTNGNVEEAEAELQTEYLLRNWCGVARGSGKPNALNHDDELYGPGARQA